MLLCSFRWSRVLVDVEPEYVEQFRGAARRRWTVSIRRRGALVVEPENLIDGNPLDLPLRSIRSTRVERSGRDTVAVITDAAGASSRIVCRNPATAARIVARCELLAGSSGDDGRPTPPGGAGGQGDAAPGGPVNGAGTR